MSATLAPSPWPKASPSGMPFGRRLVDAAGDETLVGVQWLMKRNCSISPRQLGLVFLSLCVVSAAISVFFLVQGAPFVAAFAGVELLAVGAAMIVFARHAGDHEQLTLMGRSLLVEQTIAGRAARVTWSADWLRVEPQAGQGSLVQLSGHGQTLHVGRFLRPELRGVFAQELRQALRQSRDGSAFKPTEQ